MNIVLVGTENRIAQFLPKIPSGHSINILEYIELDEYDFEDTDLVIDLNLDDTPENIVAYTDVWDKPVIGCAVKTQLAEMVHVIGGVECQLFGINALPLFLEGEFMEVSAYNKEDKPVLEKLALELGWKLKWVEDRVGMVTPRIIFMIINEAYYTVQEGTATKEDIDLGMKLGTNYPGGPFEWVEKIGLQEVYETLDALYNDTRDERYKICPLLKTEYLKK